MSNNSRRYRQNPDIMPEQDAILEQLAETDEPLPVGTWHTPPKAETDAPPIVTSARQAYEERRRALQREATAERKYAKKIAARRVIFTLGALALCLALTLGIRAYMQFSGKKLPVAQVAQSVSEAAEAKSEVLEQAMPQGLTLDPLPVVKKKRNSAWNLILPDAKNPLPADYVPRIAQVVRIDDTSEAQFDSRAVGALRQMLSDCAKAGLKPMIISAYRSHERQVFLFESMQQDYMAGGKTEKEAYDMTRTIRQIPGTSEHESGLATDITCSYQPELESTFEETPEFKWYRAHCAEYGFILRYPKDKQDITGIIYEPWHYRYVGVEDAKKIMEQGVCLEEYLD
ncbi:MAG: M15 family metallopeptidase [Ruthenibacterium sp.]